jgi:hypothetical protein
VGVDVYIFSSLERDATYQYFNDICSSCTFSVKLFQAEEDIWGMWSFTLSSSMRSDGIQPTIIPIGSMKL